MCDWDTHMLLLCSLFLLHVFTSLKLQLWFLLLLLPLCWAVEMNLQLDQGAGCPIIITLSQHFPLLSHWHSSSLNWLIFLCCVFSASALSFMTPSTFLHSAGFIYLKYKPQHLNPPLLIKPWHCKTGDSWQMIFRALSKAENLCDNLCKRHRSDRQEHLSVPLHNKSNQWFRFEMKNYQLIPIKFTFTCSLSLRTWDYSLIVTRNLLKV